MIIQNLFTIPGLTKPILYSLYFTCLMFKSRKGHGAYRFSGPWMGSAVREWVLQSVNGFSGPWMGSAVREWVQRSMNGFCSPWMGSAVREWVLQSVNGFSGPWIGSAVHEWDLRSMNGSQPMTPLHNFRSRVRLLVFTIQSTDPTQDRIKRYIAVQIWRVLTLKIHLILKIHLCSHMESAQERFSLVTVKERAVCSVGRGFCCTDEGSCWRWWSPLPCRAPSLFLKPRRQEELRVEKNSSL